MPGAEVRRVLPIDAALALVVGALSLASMRWRAGDPQDGPPGPRGMHPRGGPPFRPLESQLSTAWSVPWLVTAGVVVVVAGLALRRVFPRSAYLAVVAGTTAFLAAGGPYGPVLLAPVLAVLALADRLPLRRWLPWLAALPLMMTAGLWRQPYGGLLDPALWTVALFGSAAIILPALFLLLRRSRREADAHDRTAERDRYLYAERIRIAREVHDVVGHSLSVINLQAGVALHVLDRRPDQVAASLEAIRSTSKDALAELRHTLGMFREEGPEPTAPQAGLDRLEDLVAAVRAAGRSVELQVRDDVRNGLPGALDHAAFRIVQEALTNAVRHAGEASVIIEVARDRDRLWIRVSDSGGPVGSAELEAGNGIRGMQERAAAVGGRLEVRPEPAGGVVVEAFLPVVAEAELSERA